MSRIFWDTMLLIYLLEGKENYRARASALLARSRRRGDQLFTSCLAVGEILAGIEKSSEPQRAGLIREILDETGFSLLSFDSGAIEVFSKLRGKSGLKAPDAIHLACAASAGIDLFFTGDKQLVKLDVPGIQFIADFNAPIL